MNTNAVAKNYGCLTPEERFRLIFAASGRGDEAERDRLTNAGPRITLSMPDHSPYAHSFQELALLSYIELVDAVAEYSAEFARDLAVAPPKPKGAAGLTKDDAGKRRGKQWAFELALAAGFILRTKAEGWKLFCERFNVPPFLFWEKFPGFDRLQSALALAEKAAFLPEGMLRWMNRIRPAGKPELTEVPLTPEGIADAKAQAFRIRTQWWGGK